ncbi:SpoIIE family protein phosphatase [Nonomuraea deserti]|uniref:SpoIIE family protein phosphatase n=1 Tax=Nonomuraea deserti TaxID=1848322 RepID=UPI0034E068E5
MAHLDVRSGFLEWVNAGHPAPLLIRGNQVVEVLEGARAPYLSASAAPPRGSTHAGLYVTIGCCSIPMVSSKSTRPAASSSAKNV